MSPVADTLFAEIEKYLKPSGRPILEALRVYVAELEEERRRLREQVEILTRRVEELEGQLAKNSSNSSKPPSSDGLRKARVVSNREPSGKKPGGQPGHKGSHLKMSDSPTVTIDIRHEACSCCGESIEHEQSREIERRQVVDLPPIVPVVTEYRGTIKDCPHCGGESRVTFPEGVSHGVSYGSRIKAVGLYLMNQQLMPYERTAEICEDILGVRISAGTLCDLNDSCYALLEEESACIKGEITNSPVVNLDETGVRCNGHLQWCHTASTEQATHYEIHEKRGKEAMDAIGILPVFKGIAVHDHFSPYFGYSCSRGLCNAHHLRELKFVYEEDKEAWAGEMRELLKKANSLKDPTDEQKADIEGRYTEILQQGYAFHAGLPEFDQRKPGARGKQKQRPSKNLLDRLDTHKSEVLLFLHDPRVPFTNNQAERDLRMLKLKQKISGCYRTKNGAQIFCRIRGFISTLRKRRRDILEDLGRILRKEPVFASG
jgi:transposase